jgi:CheY-like chemotaxis protein
MARKQVRLIHWDEGESQEKSARLEAAGYDVDCSLPAGPDVLREMRRDPPDALVIDLSRLPSHGRDIALAIRHTKATRHVPLIFVEGETEKVKRVQGLLPDALFTTWPRIRSTLKRAITRPVRDPVVPKSNLAGYRGTPLVKKLGIKPESVVTLIGAPPEFTSQLERLPPGVVLRCRARGRCHLVIWFCPKRSDCERRLEHLCDLTEEGDIWIAWPKAASGMKTDLTQQRVREIGLAAGLVDYKVCAIDATWSALRFTRRKKQPRDEIQGALAKRDSDRRR